MVLSVLAESPDITFLRCPECGHFVVGFDPAPGGPTAAAYESATMSWRFQLRRAETYRECIERTLQILLKPSVPTPREVRQMREDLAAVLVLPQNVLEAKARDRG